MTMIVLHYLMFAAAHAGTPALDTIQLERLIEASKEQLALGQQSLELGRGDAARIAEISAALAKLSEGIDQQIVQLKRSQAHHEATLKLHADDGGILSEDRFAPAPSSKVRDAANANASRVQRELHQAAEDDRDAFGQLSEALTRAPAGAVPRLNAEVALAQWQTQARIAHQLAEATAALREIQRDLRGRAGQAEGFELLLNGSREQMMKREGRRE